MTFAHLQRGPSVSQSRRRAAALLAAGLLVLAASLASVPGAAAGVLPAAPAARPSSASAASASTIAADILGWLNRDRVASGLRPLRNWTSLANLADQRAANMAASETLSHAVAGGDPGAALTQSGLQWYGFGEAIGESSYPWGVQAAANLYALWKASPVHHDIMFSSAYNYIGIGIAQAGDGSTWSSLLFAESADHTPPVAANGSLTTSGTSVSFAWSGADPLLQTHTAGLRGFNIAYRVDGGAWHVIRRVTATTSLGLTGRQRGSTYSFRVQAVDRRGNLSSWTAETRVRVR